MHNDKNRDIEQTPSGRGLDVNLNLGRERTRRRMWGTAKELAEHEKRNSIDQA